MMFGKRFPRPSAAWLLLAAPFVAAGCQGGEGGALASAAKPKEPKITQSELRAYCPPVVLREGTAFHTTYEKGADADKSKVVYQTSISDLTRSCAREGGNMLMTVAAAGRVVPGPLGRPGTVTMPIRVAVVNGEEVLYSKIFQYQAQVTGATATQFVFTDPNVSFPEPSGRTVRVYVGFDEGPEKKAAEGTASENVPDQPEQ